MLQEGAGSYQLFILVHRTAGIGVDLRFFNHSRKAKVVTKSLYFTPFIQTNPGFGFLADFQLFNQFSIYSCLRILDRDTKHKTPSLGRLVQAAL